jgi:AcrR family transcriptional regulator
MPSVTRDRVTDEAVKLFARQGFADTSVAEIERAAGLKPGAGGLYAHFDSKAELLAAAIEKSATITELGYSLHAALPLADLRSELTVIARGSFVLFDASEDWIRMALKDGDKFPELFASARTRMSDRAYRYLADWLAAKVAAGEMHDHDCDAVADVLFGAVSNYWLQSRVFGGEPNDVDQERFIEAWADLALRLVPARKRR